jgi:hypothetical protein
MTDLVKVPTVDIFIFAFSALGPVCPIGNEIIVIMNSG